MKIPDSLPYLQHKKLLVLACGTSTGVLFIVDNGNWDLNYDMNLDKIRLLNKKNPFLNTEDPLNSTSVNSVEILVQNLRSRIGLFDTDEFAEIYIFCPKQVGYKFMDALNDMEDMKIEIARYGDFARKDPELLFKHVDRMIKNKSIV